MHRLFRLIPLAAALLLGGCASVSISTDYSIGKDFTGYHTYAWHPSPQSDTKSLQSMGGDIFDARVRHAVDRTLSDKGFRKSDKPDFYVNYSVVTEQRVAIDTYNTYAGYGPGWGWGGWYDPYPWGMGWGATQTNVRYYTQGTLVLDIIDAATGKLVWRSNAEGRINQDDTPQKRAQQIDQIVQHMLSKFPPPSDSR